MNNQTPPPLPSGPVSCCQGCRAWGPTKQVLFIQHIGAVVLMFNRRIRGQLCRSCVNEHFAKTTLVTAFFGWWGMISCILTPFLLLHNVIRYLFCLPLKQVPSGKGEGTAFAFVALLIGIGALSLPVYVIGQLVLHAH